MFNADFDGNLARFMAYGDLQSGPSSRFEEHYRCYSVAMMPGNERESVNYGGKFILPPSALAKLASLNIMYPMLFHITNESNSKKTSAGVLEFIAEEGRVYMPHWVRYGGDYGIRKMMKTLDLEQGQIVKVVNTTLPTGNFVKIQPQAVDFLDITDPKAVLENAMRNFSTLTQGDIIEFSYNNKIYRILVMEIRPSESGSISILETDLEVDFAPPLGYVEPAPVGKKTPTQAIPQSSTILPQEEEHGWRSFRGGGKSVKGKAAEETFPLPVGAVAPSGPTHIVDTTSLDKQRTAPPAINMPPGKLFFGYKYVPPKKPGEVDNEAENAAKAFEGEGRSLRVRRPGSSARMNENRSPSATASSSSLKSTAKTSAPTTSSTAPSSSTSSGPSKTPEPQKPLKSFEGRGNTLQ